MLAAFPAGSAAARASRAVRRGGARLLCSGPACTVRDVDARESIVIAPRGGCVDLEIETHWSDHIEVWGGEGASGWDVSRPEGGGLLLSGGGRARVLLPQVLGSVCVRSAEGSVRVRGKLEASLEVEAGGDVALDKARGETISVRAGGDAEIAALAEGTRVDVRAGGEVRARPAPRAARGPRDSGGGAAQLRAARVVCGELHAEARRATLESVYAAEGRVRAAEGIAIKTLHGHVRATCTGGDVSVAGILGSATVASAGALYAQFDEIRGRSALCAVGDAEVCVVPPASFSLQALARAAAGLSLDAAVAGGAAPGAEDARALPVPEFQGVVQIPEPEPRRAAASGKIARERGLGMYDTSRAFFFDDGAPRDGAAGGGGPGYSAAHVMVAGERVSVRASSWIDATLARIRGKRSPE